VPNVSEGRDPDVVAALAAACGSALLDLHTDPDHHRSVFTLAGPTTEDAVRGLSFAVATHVDLSSHEGVHPRFGALDVVPFVALDGPAEAARDAAHEFGRWIGDALGVPAFFYDGADPEGRSLARLRRDAFTRWTPDAGPRFAHPRLGAVAVAARAPLIAVNCWLDADDIGLARSVAALVRERDGGLPGVRALGLRLPSRAVAQVSMNLVALERTGLEDACTAVRAHVAAAGGRVVGIEVVGLIPRAELERCSAEFRDWAGLSDSLTLEARLAAGER
jgi:glutamate formiminotransferase